MTSCDFTSFHILIQSTNSFESVSDQYFVHVSSGDVFDMPILFITDLDVFGILNVSVTTSDDERGGLMRGI